MLFPTNFWASTIAADLFAGLSKTITPLITLRFTIQDSYANVPVIWTIESGQVFSPIDGRPLISLENADTANPTVVFDPDFSPLVEYSFILRMTSVSNPLAFDETEIITRYGSTYTSNTGVSFSSQDMYPDNFYVSPSTIYPFIEDPITQETCLRYVVQYPQRNNNILTIDKDFPLIYQVINNTLYIYNGLTNALILKTSDFRDSSIYPICDGGTVLVGSNTRNYIETNLSVRREFINSKYRVTVFNNQTNAIIEFFEDDYGFLPTNITCSGGSEYSPFIEQYMYVPLESCGECTSIYITPNNIGIYINNVLNTLLPKDGIYGALTSYQQGVNTLFRDDANNLILSYQGPFNTVKYNNQLIYPTNYSIPAGDNNLFKELMGLSPTKLSVNSNLKQLLTNIILNNSTVSTTVEVRTDCYLSNRVDPTGCAVLNSQPNCYDYGTEQVGWVSPSIAWLCPINTPKDSYYIIGSGILLIEEGELKIVKFDSTQIVAVRNYLVAEGIADSLIPGDSTWASIDNTARTLLINSYIFKPVSSIIKNLPCVYTINYTDSSSEVIEILEPVCPNFVVNTPSIFLNALSIQTFNISNLLVGSPYQISITNGTLFDSTREYQTYAELYVKPSITYDTNFIYQNSYPVIEIDGTVQEVCYMVRNNYLNFSNVSIEVPCVSTITSKFLEFDREYIVVNNKSFDITTTSANLLTNIPINQIEWSITEGIGTINYPNVNMTNDKIVIEAKYSNEIITGLTVCYETPL